MSDDNDETFLGPSYLENYDLFPYNIENFAQCDPAVQLQWCLDLQCEVEQQIESLKKHQFNAPQKRRKLNDLYERYYVHVGAAGRIKDAIRNTATKFNGMH